MSSTCYYQRCPRAWWIWIISQSTTLSNLKHKSGDSQIPGRAEQTFSPPRNRHTRTPFKRLIPTTPRELSSERCAWPMRKDLRNPMVNEAVPPKSSPAGCCTRTPWIVNLTTLFFDYKEPNKRVNPEEATTYNVVILPRSTDTALFP